MFAVRSSVAVVALLLLAPPSAFATPATPDGAPDTQVQPESRVFEVPEPAALALFGLGLHAVARSRRRRRRVAAEATVANAEH
jgi:PEP-CTERM motif